MKTQESSKKHLYINKKRKMLQNVDCLKEYAIQNIKELDFSENFIEDIMPLIKLKLTNLILLNLSNNFIQSLEGFNHGYYFQLQYLYLYGNQISEIQPLALTKMSSLKQLKLGFSRRGNQIIELSSMKTCSLPSLQWLCLDSNEILSISPLIECKLKQLTHLYVCNNHLTSIDYLVFSNTPKLKVLSIAGNYLTNISFLAKVHLQELQYINLQQNQITEVSCLFKYNLKKLEKINICQNLLSNEISLFKCHLPNISKMNYTNQMFIYRQRVAVQIYQAFSAGPVGDE